MELFDDVFRSVAQGKEFAEIFTPEIIDSLAELSDSEYDVFRVQLDAHLILNQVEIKDIKNLDKLVRAARARLEEKRSRLPLALLKEQMPDAPHANNTLFVPPGWMLAPDGVYCTDAQGVPKLRACTSPVYVAEKRLDPDRRRTHLVLAAKAGEWRTTVVPASSPGKKAASVAADMGVLVLDTKAFSQYWDDFLRANWDALPTAESDCALYDELVAYAADNIDKVSDGPWGKIVDGKEGSYLALKPEVARKFAKTAGVDYDHLLTYLREKGFLFSDGGSRLKTVWFNGRARRMVAVLWSRQVLKQCSVGEA